MVTRMSEWEKLQKKHPAIEPRPISTISGEIPKKSQRVADGLQEVADAPAENAKTAAIDLVNKPPHYNQGGIECIDAIESSMSKEAFAGHCKACVLKYLWRYKDKGGVESLEKAQWYLSRLINTEKKRL